MDFAWYFARLRNMGPAEIAHRVGERVHQRLMRGRQGWTRYRDGRPFRPLPALPEAVLAANPPQRAALLAAATRSLEGRFEALGRAWPQRRRDSLFPPALWRLDPVSGEEWPGPEAYCFDIDFRAKPALGDVKYVWEINRLQFLVPLAAAGLLKDDRRAIIAVEEAIASWHAANPPFGGVAWASGIEVALRSISLAVATSLLGDRLNAATRGLVGEILAASHHWLSHFPSKYSSANNHRVAELAGLFVIAMVEERPIDGVRAELTGHILKQIRPDGVGAEQTPTYAAFTVELALLCAHLARAAQAPFPAEFDKRLGAFAGWIAWLGGGGPTPAIGDDDEGRVLALGTHEHNYPRSVAAAVAGYLGVAGLAPDPGDLRTLVFGAPRGNLAPPRGLRTFPDGGCSVWSGGHSGHRLHLVFDHGPLGYLSIAAHGHADALSLILSVDGQPVLVDPGTYLYGSGGDWRRWFRSTPAHNTLNISGADQSIMAGPFNWLAKAATQLEDPGEASGLRLVSSHDGYLKRFGVIHRRVVALVADGMEVTDELLGPEQEAEIVFQLAPGLGAEQAGNEVAVTHAGRLLLRMELPPGAVSLSSGGEGLAGGWVSPRFGAKVPATRIAWRGVVGPGGVATRLVTSATVRSAVRALDTQPAQT